MGCDIRLVAAFVVVGGAREAEGASERPDVRLCSPRRVDGSGEGLGEGVLDGGRGKRVGAWIKEGPSRLLPRTENDLLLD